MMTMMNKKHLLYLLLFFTVSTYAQENYILRVTGNASNNNEACGTENYVRVFARQQSGLVTELFNETVFNGSNHTINKTFPFDSSNPIVEVYTEDRRQTSDIGGCNNNHTTHTRRYPISSLCYITARGFGFGRGPFVRVSGQLRIEIYPDISIAHADGSDTACLNSAKRIVASSTTYPEPDRVYQWEYTDILSFETQQTEAYRNLVDAARRARNSYNGCSMAGEPEDCFVELMAAEAAEAALRNYTGPRTQQVSVWNPIPSKRGQGSIDLRIEDLYPDPSIQEQIINTVIRLRIRPSCSSLNPPSEDIPLTFLPAAPTITTPAVQAPQCSYNRSNGVTVTFDRPWATTETFNLSLRRLGNGNTPLPNSKTPSQQALTTNEYLNLVNTTYPFIIDQSNNITASHAQYNASTRTYTWNTGIEEGEYAVAITGTQRDREGTIVPFCEDAYYFFEVTAPDPVIFTATHTADQDESCFQANDGIITLTASGGTGTYEYTIGSDTGSFTAAESPFDVTGIAPGEKQVFVRDTNGCSEKVSATDPDKSVAITILAATQITHTIATDGTLMPGAPGASDGHITIATISGGTPLQNSVNQDYYRYEVRNTANDVIGTGEVLASGGQITGLPAGTHTVQYTDAKDCIRSFTLPPLVDPEPITYRLEKEDPSCSTSADGVLEVTNIQGGYPDYTFAWTKDGAPYDITARITGSAGTYSLTITDQRSGSIIISDIVFDDVPTPVRIDNIDISPAECLGDDTIVTLTASGGRTGIYEYAQWTGTTSVWQDSNQFRFLSDTNIEYRFRVREKGVGCLSDISDPVTTYRNLNVNVITTIPTCFEGCDGAIALTIQGGTTPYTYRWTHNGSTEKDQTGLCAGAYTVIVTDGLDCSLPVNISVNNPPQIDVDLGEDITLCNGQSATLDATVSNPLMRYQWTSDNGFTSTQPQITVETPDVYTVTLTDEKGCTASDSIWIDRELKDIDAFFAVSDQVFAEDSFVIVNLSDPYPDSVEWELPPEAILEYGDDDYAEIRIPTAGVYQITAKVYRGLCVATDTLEVNVIHRSFEELGGTSESGLIINTPISSHEVYPNPVQNGTFTVETTLPEKQEITVRVFNIKDNQLLAERSDFGKDHYIHTFTLNLPTGVYFVITETVVGDYMVSKLVIE